MAQSRCFTLHGVYNVNPSETRLSRKQWAFLIGFKDAQSQTVDVENVSVNIYPSAMKVHSNDERTMNQVSKATETHNAGSDRDDRHVENQQLGL